MVTSFTRLCPPSDRPSTISTAAPLTDHNGVRSSIFNVPCASSVRVFVGHRQRQTLWSTRTIHGSPVCVYCMWGVLHDESRLE